jgi:hypothetical protein
MLFNSSPGIAWTDRHAIVAQRGPSKIELALGLLGQARRRELQPAYVLGESWYAAALLLIARHN